MPVGWILIVSGHTAEEFFLKFINLLILNIYRKLLVQEIIIFKMVFWLLYMSDEKRLLSCEVKKTSVLQVPYVFYLLLMDSMLEFLYNRFLDRLRLVISTFPAYGA